MPQPDIKMLTRRHYGVYLRYKNVAVRDFNAEVERETTEKEFIAN
jgi:hypothetical protein